MNKAVYLTDELKEQLTMNILRLVIQSVLPNHSCFINHISPFHINSNIHNHGAAGPVRMVSVRGSKLFASSGPL